MKNEYLFINCILKDSFIIKGALHTGFYDGSYRKMIKETINSIKKKSTNKKSFESEYVLIDTTECTNLRIILSIPNDWSPERFKEICLNEIAKNNSVELVTEKFIRDSTLLKKAFFSEKWAGLKG